MVYKIQANKFDPIAKHMTVKGDHPFIYVEGNIHRGTQYLFFTLRDIYVDGERLLDITGKPAVTAVFPVVFSDGVALGSKTSQDNFENAIGTSLCHLFETTIARESMAYREELVLWDGKEFSWDNVNFFLESIFSHLPIMKVMTKIGKAVFITRVMPNGEWTDAQGNEMVRFAEHNAALQISMFKENITNLTRNDFDLQTINEILKSLLITHVANQLYNVYPEQKVHTFDPNTVVDVENKETKQQADIAQGILDKLQAKKELSANESNV